jgi:hypothetical protein
MKRTRTTEIGDFWHHGSHIAHERLGNAWRAWLIWAFTLEEAAADIGPRSFHVEQPRGKVMMPLTLCVRAMLLGYAIECALKGLWVKNGNEIIKNRRYVGVSGAKDHNLIELSEAAGFSPTTIESNVLQHLSKFVRFAGRYPVAKTPDEMQPIEIPRIGKVDVGFFSRRDFRTAQSALNKIICKISGKKRRDIVNV